MPKGQGYAVAPTTNEDPDRQDPNLKYGWGSWKPNCLQFFNTIRWYVFWTSVFSLAQGFIVNGVINAVITSLETRFELPSTRSGLIPSSNNFIALFLVLVVTYYGGQRNKPRIIAAGILVVGLGSLVFSLPHFMTGLYNFRSSEVTENACYPDTSPNSTEEQCREGSDASGKRQGASNVQNYVYVFILANALMGIGATPMFTLGNVFIDENTRAETTSWYLGIVMAAASLGVAAGYMAGGQFLNMFTDIDQVDPSTIEITPLDPRWVGAWWIPFLICGVVMLLLVAPMAAYPKRLPGAATLAAQRRSEAYQRKRKDDGTPVSVDFGRSWRDFPKHIAMLACNPTFVFLSLSVCAEGIIVSGVAAFGAKFLQTKFNLPAAFAGFVMGMITVPGAGGGMLIGGYLVKRLKLHCRGIIRLNLAAGCLAFLTGALFLIQCPTQPSAGVNVDYDSLRAMDGPPDLTSECNDGCGCSAQVYEPVCGVDGIIYFSPCHAGCDENYAWLDGPKGPFKMYQNCSCVVNNLLRQSANVTTPPPFSTTTTTAAVPVLPNGTSGNSSVADGPPPGAHQGVCMSECKLLYVVGPLLFLGMLLTFTTVSPTQTATLRCVPENERALAIGFQWLFLRLGGTMPGPLMLGAIIDSACRVWQDTCGVRGACWVYTRDDMGIRIFVWWLLVKAFSIVCYFFAQFFYRSAPEADTKSTCNEEHEEHKEKSPLNDFDMSRLANMPESVV